MASFFTKKSEKNPKKSDDSSNEKTDSLILFSGVDLLFNGYDEAGFRKKYVNNNNVMNFMSHIDDSSIMTQVIENHKQGFWRELKKLSESSKIPIVFTADNVEANTGNES